MTNEKKPEFPMIVIRTQMHEMWAPAETLAEMSDAEIVELLNEDRALLLDGATFEVLR